MYVTAVLFRLYNTTLAVSSDDSVSLTLWSVPSAGLNCGRARTSVFVPPDGSEIWERAEA